jgi:hypothetical protein
MTSATEPMCKMLIILGPPRSFTTVVSAMLGQHPQLYGLPEVHLLGAETMAEWWEQCAHATFNMDHGLVRVIAQLYFDEQTESSVRRAAGWLWRRTHFTTGLMMEELANQVRPRILVDKSPSLVYRLDSLRRAYEMFPQARFLHLVRHPRGHGESVIKYLEGRRKLGPVPRSHWLLHLASFPSTAGTDRDGGDVSEVDPQRGWLALHTNISTFLESVPETHKLRMRGEDVLTDRDRGLAQIAEWLGLRTDSDAIEEMKHPECSPYARFGPPGATFGNDRSFLRNPALRPERAESHTLEGPLSWRKDGRGFLPEVKSLAMEFGYQ